MPKFAVLISYFGQPFCGWQRQSAASGERPSVQESCEWALEKLTGQRPPWVASGRTDAGVNAMGQVAHFRLEGEPLNVYNLLRGLNTHLPEAVRILAVVSVNDEFHAQHNAIRKQYAYYIQLGPTPLPHLHFTASYSHRAFNLDTVQQSLNHLIGEHDFLAFQGRKANPGVSSRRTIYEAEVTEVPIGFPGTAPLPSFRLIRLRVVGSGFLKHMVRSIAGTALQIGAGERDPNVFKTLVETADRKLIGTTAAPQGLWLEKVWYKSELFL